MEDFICDFLNNYLSTLEFGEIVDFKKKKKKKKKKKTFCVGRRPRPSAFLFFSTKQY